MESLRTSSRSTWSPSSSPSSNRSPSTRSSPRRAAVAAALLLLAVVGVVEAGALEVDGERVQDAHRRGAALLALGQRLVAHLLDHVEDVAVLAFVLVDRHGAAGLSQPLRFRPWPTTEPGDAPDRGDDGGDRRALQTARLRLPLLGDLRRPRLDLRLRPLRRAAQEQRQGRVVAGDAAGARRHRRARLGDPPAPAGLGGLGPPRGLHRPAGPVPRQVQAALARGPSARGGRSRRRRPRAPSCAARSAAASSPSRASST